MRSKAGVVAAAAIVLTLVSAAPATASDANVAALQVALRAVRVYGGAIDGLAGPATRRAVRGFQRRTRLTVDGVAGPRTRRALGRRGRPRLGARVMGPGRRGWDVAALQFMLVRRGFSPGGIDGGFGPGTGAALRRFQIAVGLTADGLAGTATIRALKRRGRIPTGPGDPVRFLQPVSAPIGDGFGWVSGRRHTGIDFLAPAGAAVGAAGRGVVSVAGWNDGGYGNLVVVRHRLGFATWYAHLASIAVLPGQDVVGGTLVGYVGSTGRSTSAHLHFEARLHGRPFDPLPRLLP
jgi:peptidoglycan hydrolase-like protein with peptidoglycan-binding domain